MKLFFFTTILGIASVAVQGTLPPPRIICSNPTEPTTACAASMPALYATVATAMNSEINQDAMNFTAYSTVYTNATRRELEDEVEGGSLRGTERNLQSCPPGCAGVSGGWCSRFGQWCLRRYLQTATNAVVASCTDLSAAAEGKFRHLSTQVGNAVCAETLARVSCICG